MPSLLELHEEISSLDEEVGVAFRRNLKGMQAASIVESSVEAVGQILAQPDAAELFGSLSFKLGKLLKENLIPIVGMVDEVAKVSLQGHVSAIWLSHLIM